MRLSWHVSVQRCERRLPDEIRELIQKIGTRLKIYWHVTTMATQLESSLQVSDLILQASPVVQLVMLSLLLASIYSWYLIARL